MSNTQKDKDMAKNKKIFVLDTSVILYNHNSIKSFQDNDVVIPITVLEELDNFKKGNDNINFEAREFIRYIDNLSKNNTLQDWIPIGDERLGNFKVVMNKKVEQDATKIYADNKADHKILNVALWLAQENKDRKVILVTKDINLRLKAKALELNAEDFETGKIKNIDSLYKGSTLLDNISDDIINKIYQTGSCEYTELNIEIPLPNHYFIIKGTKTSVLMYYNPISKLLEKIEKKAYSRITPRNAEQIFALHALTNPNVKLVTLQGVAGTGKTLLALAGALEQRSKFHQIYLARPIVPLSNKDIGFLPGDIKSKLNPYMEPLWDNLKFIKSQYLDNEKETKQFSDMLEAEKLLITPLAYIRGRSISNVYFIVDEAQNLTPHEVKTIITRAGEGTKIIFTGDVNQIDTPYLDSESNGLSYIIDKLENQDLYAHVTLKKGERSALSEIASKLL